MTAPDLARLLVAELQRRPLEHRTATELAGRVKADLAAVRTALNQLVAEGRVQRDIKRGGAVVAVFKSLKPGDGR